jgi:hypothetical protein
VFRPFQLQKSSQHFIRPHNEKLSIAMRVHSIADTQSKLQAALLRLSAMIYQCLGLTSAAPSILNWKTEPFRSRFAFRKQRYVERGNSQSASRAVAAN